MSTGLKVVLWIVGIIGGLIVLIVVAGFFFGRSMVGDFQEGQKFANNATHEQCVDELANRVSACDGTKCTIGAAAFGGACLGAAKGNIKEYCATLPAPEDKDASKAWSDELCRKHGINDKQKCGFTVGVIEGACQSPKK
jgi:hypothetical protein